VKPATLASWRVRKLRVHLLARKFAVPKLQRNFVWDAGRAAKLLDSIYYNMPIGSLFLWEMDRRSANLIRQSTGVLPSFNPGHAHIWFVIDGQQRLSVIHQAFEAQDRENDAGRPIYFSRLCFVANPDRKEEHPARVVYRKPIDGELVPLRDILASDWKSRMPRKSKTFLKKIGICRKRLRDYPLPVVMVRSATLDEIGEVFIRLNSQGMRITSADRAIALMGKLDVRAMAQELRQKVREKAFALGGIDSILMGFNLIVNQPTLDGGPPKLEAMARMWSKTIERDEGERAQFRKEWHVYQEAFFRAVEYLRDRLPVYDESYLPSANMIATLAIFFFYHKGQPSRFQAAEIRKWFWATGVAQRYSGRGYHLNIVKDAKWFQSVAWGKKRKFVFSQRLDPVFEIQGTQYASRSARARAFFCLLARQGPRYLDKSGEKITLTLPALSHASRPNRHHIFPQAQLSKHMSAQSYNSLCNICFLVFYDNRGIGMKLPRTYLAKYETTAHQEFRRVMRSHLIPVGEESGVWDRGVKGAFKKFRRERLKLICAAFEKEAGMKLFSRS
jgi:hypothetical protein